MHTRIRLVDAALIGALGFLAGVCLMDAQSRRAIDELAAANMAMGINVARMPVMSTADARWAPPLKQIRRSR